MRSLIMQGRVRERGFLSDLKTSERAPPFPARYFAVLDFERMTF